MKDILTVLGVLAALGVAVSLIVLAYVYGSVAVMDALEPGRCAHAYHWCLMNHRGLSDAYIQRACQLTTQFGRP